MEKVFDNLKTDLKHSLDVFRIKLLFYDLMKGFILIILFFFLYLSGYYLVKIFYINIVVKTSIYFGFLIFLFIQVVWLIGYPLFRFFHSYHLKNNLLKERILKLLPERSDLFISLYDLAFHSASVTGNEELKKAAFIQKYVHIRQNYSDMAFALKRKFRRLSMLLMILFVPLLNMDNFFALFSYLKNYSEIQRPELNIVFSIQNKNLNVEYGKPFQLKMKIESEGLVIDNVFICFGGGEFLMGKGDSLFTYDFDAVNNDIKFYFKATGVESKSFKINVLPTPEITDYEVTYLPPRYTGLKPEIFKNMVDFRVLYGSSLKFNLRFSDLDSLYLEESGHRTIIPLKSKKIIDFSRVVHNSGEFSLYGSNKHFARKNLLNFSVTCIPDLYPGIQLTEIQDSLRSSVYYFYGVISDDYGFSDLRFNYSFNGQRNTVIPIQIVKGINTQEFYFSFDFSEFADMDKVKINHYFEVFDNDEISGPKSTRSEVKNYLVPDLNSIFDYNVLANENINSSLSEAEKLAKDIVTGVKELQKKMLDNNVDNWEKQQLSKDIVEKKKKLDKLLTEVKENNLKKSVLNKSFTKQDSMLLDKQKQIQDLLDKVVDDEMKKLIDEFSKLSNEFSKDRFRNLDEKMKLTFDQMSEELDRNIELLKRFQIEEKHDLITKQLEKLKADQEKFEQMHNDRSVSKDSLLNLSKDIENSIENVKNNYIDLLEDNKNLMQPYELEDLKNQFDDLSQNLDKQSKNTSENKKDEKLSDKIKNEMKEISDKMEKQQEKNFANKSLPESDIELIIQNILIISLSQEDLLREFSNVESQSLRYNELGRLQDLKRQEYKIVKDSLAVLAKSNLMLASLLSHKFYDIEVKFGLLPGYIQDNKRGDLMREQQYIINYLNDIALSLTEALQKGKQDSKDSKENKGEKKGSKSGGNGKGNSSGANGEGYGRIKRLQNSLKNQLDNLVSQMKNGENGKPLQQGISKMIRENELFKKSLNDFISESGSLSNTEKQLLNEINRLLDENIRDMANYSISNQLINRNNQIYSKLLMSEKASMQREEYEEKRKSEIAKEIQFMRPETIFDFKKKSGLIKSDFQKSDLKLNGYFKNMYNNYYIKLGNE